MMDKTYEMEADELMKKGNKEIESIGFFDNHFGDGEEKRTKRTCKFYKSASNKYKQAKLWEKAGDALMETATKIKTVKYSDYSLLVNYKDAIDCYLTECTKQMTPSIFEKVNLCSDMVETTYLNDGKFYEAGKMSENIGDHFERNNYLTDALTKYNHANEYYGAVTGKKTTDPTIGCSIKIANIYAYLGKYQEALKKFDYVANCYQNQVQSSTPSLGYLGLKIKEIWVDCSICMAQIGDLVALHKAFDKYCSQQPDFIKSSSGRNIELIITALENSDAVFFRSLALDYADGNWRCKALGGIADRIEQEDLVGEDFC